MQEFDKVSDIYEHNQEAKREYHKGEEGVDFTELNYNQNVEYLLEQQWLKEKGADLKDPEVKKLFNMM